MNNIVVTGGSGYIGRHIVNLFANNGYNVLSLDRKPWGDSIHQGVKPYIINLQNYNEIINVFKEIGRIDCIIHCAGELGIQKSYFQKELFYQQNVFVTDCILNAAVQYHVKNFIFASSASVYADANHPVSTDSSINDHPSPYSHTKLICEEKIKSIAEYVNFNYIIFRYFNAVGCETSDNSIFNNYLSKPQLFPSLIQSCIHNKELLVNGNHYPTFDGTCIRDYINVLDMAKLHLLVYEKMSSGNWSQQLNGVYNVGTGHGRSVLDIINLCEQIIQKPIKTVFGEERFGDCQYLCADIQTTIKTFDWEPTLSTRDTLVSLFSKAHP